jgi:hypothetical protein
MSPFARTRSPRRGSRSVFAAGVVAVVLLGVGLACGNSNSLGLGALGACHLNSDCASGLVCALGACRAQCMTAADCGDGGACVTARGTDAGAEAVCQYPSELDTPCNTEADCPAPLACASDYRCHNLCTTSADCNAQGITGRVCATDANGVHYCATPAEVNDSGILSDPPPPGAPDTGVIEPVIDGAPRDGSTSESGVDATLGSGVDAGDGGAATDAANADASPYALTLTPNAVHVVRGASTPIAVTLAPPAEGDLTAMVTGLPAGVEASSLELQGDAAGGTLTLTSMSTAALGAATVTVSVGGATAALSLVIADPDTTLDETFNSGGVQAFVPASGTANATAYAAVLLADGSIVLGGCRSAGTGSGWTLAKLDSAGAVDTAFGTAATASLPSSGCVRALATDGTSLYVAGDNATSGTTGQATLYVLNMDGSLHLAFMSTGTWQNPLGSATSNGTTVRAVVPATDGSGVVYLVANQDTTGSANKPSVLYRLEPSGTTNQQNLSDTILVFGMGVDPNGKVVMGGQLGNSTFYAQRAGGGTNLAIDSTFGSASGALGVASGDLYAGAAAMDVEGGIYVGGAGTASGETPVLGHVNAAGTADLGADAGYCALGFNVQFDSGFVGLAALPDGRLWGIGNGSDQNGNLPWIARTKGTCALDPTWNGGAVLQTLQNDEVEYWAIVAYPPPDGRVVVVGSDSSVGFYAARYWP